MPTIKPGDIFFDKLPDGRYEKCILQATTEDTPNRAVVARGGTGEFYRVLNDPSEEPEADEVIWDISNEDNLGIPKILLLKKI